MNAEDKIKELESVYFDPHNPAKMHFIMRELKEIWKYMRHLESILEQIPDEDPSCTILPEGGPASPPSQSGRGSVDVEARGTSASWSTAAEAYAEAESLQSFAGSNPAGPIPDERTLPESPTSTEQPQEGEVATSSPSPSVLKGSSGDTYEYYPRPGRDYE